MSNSFLSLGSNMGNRIDNLQAALTHLDELIDTTIINISSTYESEPLYFHSNANFYNMVIYIKTLSPPDNLLKSIKYIENMIGRNTGHNESRIIDIDILTYDNLIINSSDLIIPHPRIKERKFVLQPWSEIDNNYKLREKNSKVQLLHYVL